MKYEITKSFRFEAAHSLPHLPPEHQCHRLHGHSYEIIVGVMACALGRDTRWVQDYAEISEHVTPLIAKVDHRNLNDILPGVTTAERVADWFWENLGSKLSLLSRIEVRETPTSNVILTRG
jgi:6-pyruvoyltetrahydropterin/6-carboxytetrahydropterin synthase